MSSENNGIIDEERYKKYEYECVKDINCARRDGKNLVRCYPMFEDENCANCIYAAKLKQTLVEKGYQVTNNNLNLSFKIEWDSNKKGGIETEQLGDFDPGHLTNSDGDDLSVFKLFKDNLLAEQKRAFEERKKIMTSYNDTKSSFAKTEKSAIDKWYDNFEKECFSKIISAVAAGNFSVYIPLEMSIISSNQIALKFAKSARDAGFKVEIRNYGFSLEYGLHLIVTLPFSDKSDKGNQNDF